MVNCSANHLGREGGGKSGQLPVSNINLNILCQKKSDEPIIVLSYVGPKNESQLP